MNKKTKGIVAGVAGGALLLGAGGTFALWSDEEQVVGGAITAGTLDVQAERMTWYDVSPDRDDAQGLGVPFTWDVNWIGEDEVVWNGVATAFRSLDANGTDPGTSEVVGHTIDNIDSWRTVPGDFVLGEVPVRLEAMGDNVNARLTVEAPQAEGELAQALGLRFFVFDHAESTMQPAVALGEPIHMEIKGEGFRDLRVYVLGNFPSGVDGQELMSNLPDHGGVDVGAFLGSLDVRVEQVRG